MRGNEITCGGSSSSMKIGISIGRKGGDTLSSNVKIEISALPNL